jgi:hypothetical protein
MPDEAAFRAVRDGLMQPARGLYIAPIRHHSPACAWAVRELIRSVKPKRVLIEAPADFEPHIELLLHAETKPPVAIAALIEEEKERRVAAYYPFCAHAPEFVALQEGKAAGARLSFIDLPSSEKLGRRGTQTGKPVTLNDDAHFDSSDYIRALCKRTGCRDGFELWDHLFETRLGDPDWRSFLGDVGAYCAGTRAATSQELIEQEGDAAREAQMAAAMLLALDEGGPVVIVVGGFHAPALVEAAASGGKNLKFRAGESEARSYLIRYSFAALDALNGYAAGLPQPAYYDLLWRHANEAGGAPAWREIALDLASGFATRSRKACHPVGLPQQVEMLRAAEALAQMRGRPGALRHDLIDGARTALVKGEAGLREVWTERLIEFLRGEAIGDVPASAGSPPLVEDARSLARAHRFDISDGARRKRRLDIRRKPSQLAASRFLHAMEMLGAGFAERETGPDYLNNTQTELLFEEWGYAWSPRVEGRLIELAARADTVKAACLGMLTAKRDELRDAGQGRDIASMAGLFAQGLIAGLGRDLEPFLNLLAGDIEAHGDFAAVAHALRRLHMIAQSSGPLRAPPELTLDTVNQAAYRRLVYLCDDLPRTPAEGIATRIDALRIMAEILGGETGSSFDRSIFDDAIDRVADAGPPPEILGAVLSICVQARRREPEALRSALAGQFSGSVLRQEDRIGALRGMLQTTPALMLHMAEVLKAVDGFLSGMDDAAFMDLLPHLRLAFAALNPREIDQLASQLARLHGGQAGAYHAVSGASEADLARGIELDKQLRASIEADGLSSWLLGAGAP